MTEAESGKRHLFRRHGAWAIGILCLLAVLAWLTWDVHPDVALLVYVAVLAGLHRWLATTRNLTRKARENMVFLVLTLGLLGMLWMLTGMNVQALAPIMIAMAIFALFALGLNLQFGYTGIINFGHVAFMGIGAYTVAIVTLRVGDHVAVLEAPGWLSVSAVALSAVFVFLVVGFFVTLVVEWATRLATKGAAGDEREAKEKTGPGPGKSTKRRRTEVGAGALGGALAVVVLLLVVPFPLTPMWSMTYLLAGAVLLGMVFAMIAGLLLGLPALRLRADYLAIVTIGAAEILRRTWLNESWLTQGPLGLSVSRGQRPFDVAFGEWQWPSRLADILDVASAYTLLLLLMLIAAVLFVFVCYEVLSRSPYGRVLRAVREDEDLAAALGKNVFAYKLQVLMIGGAVAALAGAFLLWQQHSIVPNNFHPLITFYAWIIVVAGGAGKNKGTILGAVILWTFIEATRFLNLSDNLGITGTQAGALRIALIGVLLILLMLFKPEGILGRREELVLGD